MAYKFNELLLPPDIPLAMDSFLKCQKRDPNLKFVDKRITENARLQTKLPSITASTILRDFFEKISKLLYEINTGLITNKNQTFKNSDKLNFHLVSR